MEFLLRFSIFVIYFWCIFQNKSHKIYLSLIPNRKKSVNQGARDWITPAWKGPSLINHRFPCSWCTQTVSEDRISELALSNRGRINNRGNDNFIHVHYFHSPCFLLSFPLHWGVLCSFKKMLIWKLENSCFRGRFSSRVSSERVIPKTIFPCTEISSFVYFWI